MKCRKSILGIYWILTCILPYEHEGRHRYVKNRVTPPPPPKHA